jgi:hypothetical protein
VRETASEDLHPVAAKHFVNSGVNLEAWGEEGVADPEQSGPSDGLLRVGLALWDAQTRTDSRGPLIFVHQPAKPIASHHHQLVRVGSIVIRRWTVRRREVQASVRPMPVVMINVDSQDALKVTRTQNEQPIETLGTDRPNESFRDRVCPRRLNRRANDTNAGAPKIRHQSCA